MHPKMEKFLVDVNLHIDNLEMGDGSSEKTSYGEASPAASSAPTFLKMANAAAAKQVHHL
jgi:hypothetical protein